LVEAQVGIKLLAGEEPRGRRGAAARNQTADAS
jgi:hypothetical protein